MIQFTATATSSGSDEWMSEAIEEQKVGIPPAFGGANEVTSPEDLFLLSLVNCFVATFQVVAKKSGAAFDSITVNGILHVDNEGKPRIDSCDLQVEVRADDQEKINTMLQVTQNNCLVHNAVGIPVRVELL